MLPNMLIIGAGKAGTTSLHRYLGAHPDVFMSAHKELHFFSNEHRYALGASWYAENFEAAGEASVIGEASPTYTMFPRAAETPARIHSLIPDVKLIYAIRDPVERIRSLYIQRKLDGRETRDFETALRERSGYVQTTCYALQIDHYMKLFDRDRLLVIVAEDLRDDRTATMRRVASFLDIDPAGFEGVTDTVWHQTQQRRHLNPWLKPVVDLVRGSEARGGGTRVLPPPPPRPEGAAMRVIRRFVTAPVKTDDVVVTPQIRAFIEERVRADVHRVRDYLGADFHCWGL